MTRGRLALACALALALAGCTTYEPPEAVLGDPTGATCPPGSTLTYTSFGHAFMSRYCVRCHSSRLVGANRQGATEFHDFDTLVGLRAISDHIDRTAAIGPEAENRTMPPDSIRPTDDERRQLAEWVACGVPE